MKFGVPAFNYLLALTYFAAASLLLLLLKLTIKSPRVSQPTDSVPQYTPLQLIAISWFKKYTFASPFLTEDHQYLIKEVLILSTYAVACFGINRITLWPVTFILFMLPITVLLLEVVVKKAKEAYAWEKQGEQVANVIESGELQVEAIQLQLRKQKKKVNKENTRSRIEIGVAIGMAFLGGLLFCLTSMKLTDSVSNSAQINILSLLCIIPLDQFLIRPTVCVLLLTILKVLDHHGKIHLETNMFVLFLCSEEIQRIKASKKRNQSPEDQIELTYSHLKARNLNMTQRQTDLNKRNDSNFINLQHLEPFFQQEMERVKDECYNNELPQSIIEAHELQGNAQEQRQPKQEIVDDDQLELAMFFTTPQKQLFQGSQSNNNSQPTIITSALNKQNTQDLSNSQHLKSSQVRQLEQFVIHKNALRQMQQFTEQFQSSHNLRRRRPKKNPRVLKMTGSSPYLQYLPNMLKKVQNYKHIIKDTAKTPKML